jgi:hypothetical protein
MAKLVGAVGAAIPAIDIVAAVPNVGDTEIV